MADRISEDEIAMLMRAFNKHDTDGDGVINTAELAKVLHSLGQNPTATELQGIGRIELSGGCLIIIKATYS